jgi:hypothetical protein
MSRRRIVLEAVFFVPIAVSAVGMFFYSVVQREYFGAAVFGLFSLMCGFRSLLLYWGIRRA